MLNAIFRNPTEIYFGEGMEQECGRLITPYSHKVLVVCGSSYIKNSEFFKNILKLMEAEGIEYSELDGVVPNPRLDLVRKGIDICRKEDIGFVLAVGGGSVVDTAKAIACGAPNKEDDVWDYFLHSKEPQEILPIGVVLTVAAAGSESSDAVVITNSDTMEKLAFNNDRARPKFSILNPRVTCSVPAYQTACGVVDTMSHVFERYFTQTKFVDATDRLGEGALLSLMKYGTLIMEDLENYDYRAELMWLGKLGNDGSFGVGKQTDWASHFMEQELSAWKEEVAHGAGLAVVIPAWMKYVYTADIDRFLQFAVRVMGIEMDYFDRERTVLKGIEKLKEYFKSLGMPTTLRELGFTKDQLAPMAKKCANSYGGTLGHFKVLSADDIEKIYEIAF